MEDYPATVHQATGMIAEQCQCSIDQALARLLRYAENRGETVDLISAQVIARSLRLDA